MKKYRFLSAIIILFTALNLASCGDTEPIDDTIPVPIPTNPGQPAGDCADPIGFQVSEFINGSSVNLSWVAGGEETSWEVSYGVAGFVPGSGTEDTTSSTNLTITGLNPGIGYHFYVRAECPDGGYSNWVGPVSIGNGTATCSTPSGLTAVRTDANLTKILVSWTATGSPSQYEIQYGFAGFTPGNGTSVFTGNTSKTLNNMSQNQDFDIWVRAICSANDQSFWVGPIKVEAINALSANVNAVPFGTAEVTAGSTVVEDLEYIEVSATNEDGEIISVFVKKNLGVGTYTVSPDVIMAYTLDGDVFAADPTLPMSVTITERTPHSMVGTFHFTAKNETDGTLYTITNGTFAVTF